MDPLPRTGARRLLAGNRFFDLVEEEIEDRQGRMYPYYTVASKWDAVVAVPVLPDGRLLVERIYRHPCRAWLHEFPAGGIEPGEEPCAAGGRELREETGWSAGRITPLQTFEAMPGLLRMRLHLVLAEELSPGGERALEAAEFIQVETMTVDEAWQLARRETASSFLTLGLMALRCARP
ncbi:MAG: NUDIX hydrolase [Planctomycetes bacterium]|nr:NUDIX hydrolase [Planctomycetota bacterium]